MQHNKMKILIWGVGANFEKVLCSINYEHCVITGLVDTVKSGIWKNYKIISPEEIKKTEYNLIIISTIYYGGVIRKCMEIGIPIERVFWDDKQGECLCINEEKRRDILFKSKIKTNAYEQKKLNMPYERGKESIPIIRSGKEALKKIIRENKSLCRFGDGEFEIIRGKERPWFQECNKELAMRLLEVLKSDDPQILVAIADNFGNLDKYTEEAANGIRHYMTGEKTRTDITKMLDLHKVYFDAYVTRPYMMYKDKTWAKEIFGLMKQMWKNRKLLIVEGKNSYMGAGNDLLDTASNIRRIICPEKNAFYKYERIFESICKYVQADEMVLVTLGPTATVLAYDLAKLGIQAIDIGQVDNEYEWYRMKSNKREEIPGKCVAELAYWHTPPMIQNEKYQREIITRIID